MNNGKGSRRRPEDAKKIAENWDRSLSAAAEAREMIAAQPIPMVDRIVYPEGPELEAMLIRLEEARRMYP